MTIGEHIKFIIIFIGGIKVIKFKKPISILTIIIIVLSLGASIYGIFSGGGPGKYEFKSITGQVVQIYGSGLYQNNSISLVSQGIAQDIITIVLGVPLLVLSLYLFRKGLVKGNLLLSGTLCYFLYTYVSYTFLWMYNPMFLIYVILMSTCFFAFVLTMMCFDMDRFSTYFNEKMPVKFFSGFLFFLATVLLIMWLGIIISPLINNTFPVALEHYTTLVIQAMDLAFVVPTAILAGVLLLKRKAYGYLLASIITIKGLSMSTVIMAMLISQILAGLEIGLAVIVVFAIINLLMIYFMILIMKNIKEPTKHLF